MMLYYMIATPSAAASDPRGRTRCSAWNFAMTQEKRMMKWRKQVVPGSSNALLLRALACHLTPAACATEAIQVPPLEAEVIRSEMLPVMDASANYTAHGRKVKSALAFFSPLHSKAGEVHLGNLILFLQLRLNASYLLWYSRNLRKSTIIIRRHHVSRRLESFSRLLHAGLLYHN